MKRFMFGLKAILTLDPTELPEGVQPKVVEVFKQILEIINKDLEEREKDLAQLEGTTQSKTAEDEDDDELSDEDDEDDLDFICGDLNLYKGPLDKVEPIAEFKVLLEKIHAEKAEYFNHLI